ncbi:MAG: hypothetical protein NT168_03495 [Planctomycetota bacterium]|nr:hypothetical protein [Planctomycetota bacterium]
MVLPQEINLNTITGKRFTQQKSMEKLKKNPESFFCTGSRRSGLMAIARGWRHAAHKRKSPAGEPTSASAWAI